MKTVVVGFAKERGAAPTLCIGNATAIKASIVIAEKALYKLLVIILSSGSLVEHGKHFETGRLLNVRSDESEAPPQVRSHKIDEPLNSPIDSPF